MKRSVRNGARGCRQAYTNKVKYDPNKYKLEKEKVPECILISMTKLCCRRCCEIIQWKADYGKYRPLERARKCNLCGKKSVVLAYHHICHECACSERLCSKCQRNPQDNSVYQDKRDFPDDSDCSFQQELSLDDDNKYSFLKESEYEELKYLKGLDVRLLEQDIIRREYNKEVNEARKSNEYKRTVPKNESWPKTNKESSCSSSNDEFL
ncbi:unnamed protein product [Phytomonas sp. Hart1]|nr:unnamed protein product [Phytomonas sp. Hart1]|eukprot:CCW67577.1 unnamed protein product [Phytomonas sp. isolate Hart1]